MRNEDNIFYDEAKYRDWNKLKAVLPHIDSGTITCMSTQSSHNVFYEFYNKTNNIRFDTNIGIINL